MSAEQIRVLVVDDHAVVREGVRPILEGEPGFVVVAEAGNGADALGLTAERHPGVGGADGTRTDAARTDATRTDATRSDGAGARIESRESAAASLELLTAREREVLDGIARGLTNKEIAGELGISHRTVETHRESLMRKLRIHTVAGLTKFALETGLITA